MNLVSFDISPESWAIPQALGEFEFSIDALAGSTPILGAAGVWDSQGDVSVVRPGRVRVRFAITGSTWAAVDAAVDAARAALFGGRGLLKLAVGDDLTTADRQATARCVSFTTPYTYDKLMLVVCDAEFEILQPHWDAVSASSSTRTAASFSITNSGTAPVNRTLVIKINGPLTSAFVLSNAANGMSFTYDGTSLSITSGHYVEIDCGALTVRYDGLTDVWPYFSIGNNQTAFMALEAGANVFTQSPAQTLNFIWQDAWW